MFVFPAPALLNLQYESPKGHRTYGENDIAVQLMFYSTFEVLDLLGSDPMETRRVVKLYEHSPTPILYAGPVSNVLGQVPLMPLFLGGKYTTTIPVIPHCFCNLQCSKFPYRGADVAKESGRTGAQKQGLRGQPRVVALWEGQASSGGYVSV